MTSAAAHPAPIHYEAEETPDATWRVVEVLPDGARHVIDPSDRVFAVVIAAALNELRGRQLVDARRILWSKD